MAMATALSALRPLSIAVAVGAWTHEAEVHEATYEGTLHALAARTGVPLRTRTGID